MRKLFHIFLLLFIAILPSSAQKKRQTPPLQQVNTWQRQLEEEEWEIWDGNGTSLHDRLMHLYTIEHTLLTKEGEEPTPRYLIGIAYGQHTSLRTAIRLAETQAKKELVTQMDVTITDVTTMQRQTIGENSSNHMGSSIDQRTQTGLGHVEEILTIYRKKQNRQYEVKVYLAVDLAEIDEKKQN